MKEKRLANTAFVAWLKRYWSLVFVLVLFAVPIIVLVMYGFSLDDALRAVSVIHVAVLGHRYTYKPGDDIILAVLLLVTLAFIVFSAVRYLYKSKK